MKAKATLSKEPQIGIFWYYKKRLIVYSLPAEEVPVVCGFKDIDRGHCEHWDTVKATYAGLRDLEYDEVPRGRVLFDAGANKFKVYSSTKLIETPDFQEKVIQTFSLPVSRMVFESDLHYEQPENIY